MSCRTQRTSAQRPAEVPKVSSRATLFWQAVGHGLHVAERRFELAGDDIDDGDLSRRRRLPLRRPTTELSLKVGRASPQVPEPDGVDETRPVLCFGSKLPFAERRELVRSGAAAG